MAAVRQPWAPTHRVRVPAFRSPRRSHGSMSRKVVCQTRLPLIAHATEQNPLSGSASNCLKLPFQSLARLTETMLARATPSTRDNSISA